MNISPSVVNWNDPVEAILVCVVGVALVAAFVVVVVMLANILRSNQ